MARSPIEIGIASETKAFRQGVESGIIDPLEDAIDKLKDLGDAKGAEQLERAMRDAQEQTEELADESAATARVIEQKFTDGYRDMKRSSDDATDAAKKGMDEVKVEAASTAKESAASFDGSADSIVDAFQEIAANAFAGFGPAGLVAGLAAAAGIGLAVSGFQAVDEAQKESEERAAGWADAYVKAGGRVLSSSITTARALEIITDTDGKFKEAEKNAKDWGVGVETAVAAMAGETWALSAAQETLARRSQGVNEMLEQQARGTDSNAASVYRMAESVDAGTASLDQLTGEMADGAGRADVFSRYLVALAKNTAGAKKNVDDFGDSVYELPDGTTVYIDAETGQATRAIEDVENKIYAADGKTATMKILVDKTDAIRSIDDFRRNAERAMRIPVSAAPAGIASWQ